MYGSIKKYLQDEIEEIKEAGLYKSERIITSSQDAIIKISTGEEVINFCANNYLGLSNHPEVIQAAKDTMDTHGFGVSSVRFICGTQDIHKKLESKITEFYQTEDTILYAAAFDANGGVFEPLLTKEDAIISDSLNHASIIDGVRLCKAARYRYAHSDMADLEQQLIKAQEQRHRIIVTDGVFSARAPATYNTENIVLNATTQGATNYIWKLNGAVLPGQNSNTLNINSPHDPVNESGIYEVEVYVSGILCGNDTIEIEFAPEITVNQTSFVQCDNDGAQDGIRSFELYNLVDDIFPNLPSDFDVSFYFDPSDSSPLPNFYQNSVPYTQTIYAKFNKYQNCYAAIPITLNVNTFEDNILNEIIGYCAGNSVELEADSGYPFYQWETGENSQSIIVNTPGNYIVTIGNSLNCTKQKTFTVVPSEIATIENIEISDFSESNSALIEVIGSGDYEYSLDGINYQDEPLFTNLEPGEYTLFVNDKNGCGTQIDNFYILGYPNFFTPNGDGFNDVWQIKNLDKRGFENAKITIFDRYGNLIKQINNPNDFWDGTLRGNNLPSQDYWFVLALPNGKTIRGHFSLIR